MVLSWLRRGFKPKFVGMKDAKPQKRAIVESMLRRVVPKARVGALLEGKLPHKVEFANHRSFYTNWGFSKGEIEKLVVWGAASIWEDPKEGPVVISPLRVADSAGKQRLIINEKYVNLFLDDLPFQYERLRDILAFTEEGSYMATWDLKSGYFHVPIHPRFRKYRSRSELAGLPSRSMCSASASPSVLRVYQGHAGASNRAKKEGRAAFGLHRRHFHSCKDLSQMLKAEFARRAVLLSVGSIFRASEVSV